MKQFMKHGASVKQFKDGTFRVRYKAYEAKVNTLEEVDTWLWNMAENHDIYREINERLNEVFQTEPKIIRNENIKYIDNVRIIRLFDGKWYALFNDFRTIRTAQMKCYSLDGFVEWCKENNVNPIKE